MDEDLLHGLRWVLLTDESGWRAELDVVLGPIRGQRARLEEVRALLSERLPGADPAYRPRMQAMIQEVQRAASGAAEDSSVAWSQLARAWSEADRRLEGVERELEAARRSVAEVTARIRAQLAPGGHRVEGELRFERQADREVVSVVDADRVPRELCRSRPDPELLRRALRDTGQAPPGTVVVVEPGEVDFVRLGSG